MSASDVPTGCVRLLRHLCFEVCTVGKASLFRSVRGWQANGIQPCSSTPAKSSAWAIYRRLMLGAMTWTKSAPGAKTDVPSIHNNNNNETETSAYTPRQSGARSGSPQ